MKTIALFNPASGSVPPDGGERLRAALEASGVWGADMVQTDPEDCEGQLKKLAASEPDMFVVWGGDGTLKSALQVVGQATPNLLLLPGGTMNLLPKTIHGEKAWDVILRDVLESPKRRMLPAGKVNDDLFFCAMLAGAPAHFAEARESLRRGELVKAATEARAAIDTLNTLHLHARYGEGYNFDGGTLPTTSIIGAVVGSLTKAGTGMEVEIGSDDGGDIPVISDGEHIEAGPKVRVSFVEEAAQCLTAA
jgi:diacylglycerol kinase family enzyme